MKLFNRHPQRHAEGAARSSASQHEIKNAHLLRFYTWPSAVSTVRSFRTVYPSIPLILDPDTYSSGTFCWRRQLHQFMLDTLLLIVFILILISFLPFLVKAITHEVYCLNLFLPSFDTSPKFSIPMLCICRCHQKIQIL